ncbi:MAG: hypothetical protein IRZ00_20945 [Gemmatimonadetes bacterium]|nr:hypothetical protein [Gemmatimonadota bacterium]
MRAVGVRWTVGDVSRFGYEALRASLHGAVRTFGATAAYAVVVNTIPVDRARALVGDVPAPIEWIPASGALPTWLAGRVDAAMADGVAWKLAPLRVFPDRLELALDNDCILWDLPPAVRAWLEGDDGAACVVAEDVARCFGRFDAWGPPEPRNAGIRGIPPGDAFERELRRLLDETGATLATEQDEQGLQVAALYRLGGVRVVGTDDVAICSPFPPHRPELGRCGAHFVGLNVKAIPWTVHGRPAVEHLRDHWLRHRAAVFARVGLPAPTARESRAA